MQRIENYKLLYATNDILGKVEIKTSLNAKQIYSVSKLNNKLEAINKVTVKKQDEARKSYNEALKAEGITEEQKKELTETFNADWKTILDEEVGNPVEVKIPFEASEKIMQYLDKSDVTQTVIEYLIAEPSDEKEIPAGEGMVKHMWP